MNNSTEKLYHYTTGINAIKILSSKMFKFGHLHNTNDPFEKLENRVNIQTDSFIKRYLSTISQSI